jgi:glycosyltransferase involved in cell wall biosynthesis
MWSATRQGLPLIVTFHGGGHSSRLRGLIRRPQRAALRPLLARAARLVAVADFEVDVYSRELRLPRDRFAVIPNGVEIPSANVEPPSADEVLIASVGRLERYKGHHRVIAALPHLLEAEPRARLWIAGAGPYEARLRRLALRLGVGDRVEIRAIESEDPRAMTDALVSTSLVVLLSEFETHPLAALEARAAGRKLLVADTSGLRALAETGQARAIPLTASPRETARAMLDQLQAPSPPAPRFLTWEESACRLRALYGTVLQEARCGS